MKIAVITLSREGAVIATRIVKGLAHAELYVHELVDGNREAHRFSRVADLTAEIFSACSGLVYVAPIGVVVRALAPNLKHKTEDPAVVVTDVGGRFAVSLLSGHEGGANDLALKVGNILAAEPIISTSTEALKTLIVGVGCRRDTRSEKIVSAVKEALGEAGLELSQVRLIVSADIKGDEEGLLLAAQELGLPLRLISSPEIRNSAREFTSSHFVESKVNLPAVAEPSALLGGRRTRLLVPKKRYNGVTIAVAKESCLWSE